MRCFKAYRPRYGQAVKAETLPDGQPQAQVVVSSEEVHVKAGGQEKVGIADPEGTQLPPAPVAVELRHDAVVDRTVDALPQQAAKHHPKTGQQQQQQQVNGQYAPPPGFRIRGLNDQRPGGRGTWAAARGCKVFTLSPPEVERVTGRGCLRPRGGDLRGGEPVG